MNEKLNKWYYNFSYRVERFFLSDKGVVTFAAIVLSPVISIFLIALSHTK
jgi:hypothetical protein